MCLESEEMIVSNNTFCMGTSYPKEVEKAKKEQVPSDVIKRAIDKVSSGAGENYETVTYEVKITNKTDNYIVIADNKQKNEIALEFDGQKRTPTNMQLALFFVNPNSTRTQELVFTKFFDEEIDAKKLYFGAIRILKEYDWKQGTTEENLNNAVKLYGLGIDF